MSHHHLTVADDLWFVAYTEETGVVHFGLAEAPATITSGQKALQVFGTEPEMGARVDEIKGVAGWYEANKPAPIDPASNVT